MKTLVLVFVGLLSFLDITIGQDTQDLILPQGRKYLYQDVIVDYHQLEEAFSTNNEAFYFYDKSLRQKKAATVWGISSLALIGGGIAIASQYDSRDQNYTPLILGVIMVLASPVPGIIGIALLAKSNKNKKRSISVFNGMEFHSSIAPKSEYEMTFGLTGNGIGVAYNF